MAHRAKWHRFLVLGLAAGFLLGAGAWALQHSMPPLPPPQFFADTEEPDTPDMEPPPEQFDYVWTRLAYESPEYRWADGNTRSWITDYPKADRQFLQGLLRYTRIHGRKREQVVRVSDPKLFDYPFIYAVEVGYMQLSDEDASRLREYLLRGGFLIVDDFHGSLEWANFEREMKKVFPDRQIRDVPLSDPIFHCFFDIEELFQVPGLQYLYTGRPFEKDGVEAAFRGIYDDDGRIMVMINFNSDLGDAWEWADLPWYPEKLTSQAYRLGVNYIVYSMSH